MNRRFTFFDVLRGIAVLWMIQTHVTNVFLEPALRTGWFFELLNISNGFVAPAFVFCAGGGLWIALSRKGPAFRRFDGQLWDFLRRLSYVLFWAYMLHIPAFSLAGMMEMHSADLLWGLQADVLQTIVFGMLLSVVVYLIVADTKRFTVVMGVMAVLASISTVFLWRAGTYLHLPDFLAVMVTPSSALHSGDMGMPYSPFPLLPWIAYLFAGAFTMGIFMPAQNKDKLAKWFIGLGLTIPVILFWVKGLAFESPWSEVWWRASPSGQLFRVCGILFLFGSLYLMDSMLGENWLGRKFKLMGQESLLLYVSHLLIVYGNGPKITQALFGFDSTGALGVVVIWLVVTIPLIGFAIWWHGLKRKKPIIARRLLTIQIVWMFGSILLSPAGFSWFQ